MSKKINARLRLLEMVVTPPSAESDSRFWAWWRGLPRDSMEERWQEIREDAPAGFFSSQEQRQEWIDTAIGRERQVEELLQEWGEDSEDGHIQEPG